ncbi:uncharacterized protein LOC143082833 isoform X13 [Mytilus galloprovincialis]|uniref:uncharacterized protein LOC143082833 isoform X13 n=1 Tax=Mytilus galloprovincialis TaxID=29158 RepID=UPI003F7B6DDC
MNQYQKVYMNQIHSSSLLGQLAQMWKSQMLCDALIRTGNVTTKAHRVVLVAACPMLQSMDNASVGSHLEVRLAADIKQEAVNSFLQYLYEGFMMLSEENCKDVEKVARLLQVDSVTKCCIDFYNCLQKKTGVPVYSNTQYKYSSADLLEFRHVRTTDLQKTLHERMMKRAAADSVRPTSPSGKRQRMQQQRPPSPNIDLAMFGQKADDTLSMTHSYMGNTGNQAAGEPWERVPRIGAIHSQRPSHPKPGVIEIVEDSLEILQTQPPDKDGNKSAPPIIQKSLAISVSSQLNSSQDVHVVNVNDSSSHPTAAGDGPIMSTGRDSITVSPLTVMPGTSSLSSSSASSPLTKDPHKSTMDKDMLDKQTYAKKLQSSLDHQSSTPQRGLFPVSMSPANMSPINQVKKSFAAGSASQAASMSQSHDSPTKRTSTSAGNEMERPQSSDQGKDLGTKNKVDDRSASNSTDMAPDLSIVKVEPTGEAGLDMYVDVPEESMIQAQQREQREHDDESDLELEEASGDWSRDEMSNEAAGGDQNNSWYIGQFKDEMQSYVPMRFLHSQIKQLDFGREQFEPDHTSQSNLAQPYVLDDYRNYKLETKLNKPSLACKSQSQRKGKVKILDPKFWDLPLITLIGNQPEELNYNMNNFVCLSTPAEPFIISDDTLSLAMTSSMSQRHRFATTVFRHICTIGDIYHGNVSGKFFRAHSASVVNRKISPLKMNALEQICFEYFPSSPNDRDKDWKIIVTALHKAVWYGRKYIRNLLDISAIEDCLQ